MTDEPLPPNTAEMEAMGQRIRAIQARHRDRVRWHIGKHTAELTIAALADRRVYRKSAKARRRKNRKRLL